MGISCSSRKKSAVKNEKILAIAAGRKITVDEFIRRAEYTIRPDYCSQDNYIHKKIVLNSLIAEKLFSAEAGRENRLERNENFQDYLKGRREQAMRQLFYTSDFYYKVKLKKQETLNKYNLSRRKYRIAYYTIKDEFVLKDVEKKFQQGKDFNEIFFENGGIGDIPAREVSMKDGEHEVIIDALFTAPLKKGEVFGPLEIEENYNIFIKILGLRETVLITENQKEQRLKDIKELLRKFKANKEYYNFVGNVMKNKKMEFNPDIFYKLAELVVPYYMKSDKQKEEAFNRKFWNKKGDNSLTANNEPDINKIADQPLFRIDGTDWSVKRVMDELNVHPLVFRKRRMKHSEFPEQFKLALVDMIRDRYITKEAYKRGYDKSTSIKQYENMWKDNLKALFYKNNYLKSLNLQQNNYKDIKKIIKKELNPLFNKLQEKYNDSIKIDTDAFEKIKLTHIDMFVIQRNVPFPIAVPSFPLLTTDSKIDYGSKMEK